MDRSDIEHVGRLARVRLSEAEIEQFSEQLPTIISYVGVISSIAADETDSIAPQVGARYNVLRPDVVTNEPGQYTDALLAEIPAREGQFMKVKKILHNPDA